MQDVSCHVDKYITVGRASFSAAAEQSIVKCMVEVSGWQRWWLKAAPHRLTVRWHVPVFLRTCPEPIRGQVLEVGAGQGYTSKRILETFPQVELTATDIDAVMLSRLESLTVRYGRRLRVQQADVLHLPFDRAAFDFALAINLLWRLSETEQETALRELIR